MVTNQQSSPALPRFCPIDQTGRFEGASGAGVPIKMSKPLIKKKAAVLARAESRLALHSREFDLATKAFIEAVRVYLTEAPKHGGGSEREWASVCIAEMLAAASDFLRAADSKILLL